MGRKYLFHANSCCLYKGRKVSMIAFHSRLIAATVCSSGHILLAFAVSTPIAFTRYDLVATSYDCLEDSIVYCVSVDADLKSLQTWVVYVRYRPIVVRYWWCLARKFLIFDKGSSWQIRGARWDHSEMRSMIRSRLA